MSVTATQSYIPTHRDFVVEFASGAFQSSLKSLKVFEVGEILASLDGAKKGPKSYRSTQCGPGLEDHVEVGNDFVYVNHSCEPSAVFDLSSLDPLQWHIRAVRRIEPEESVTYFYPSTEWDMDQPFDCNCGALVGVLDATCLGKIQGAKYLSKEDILMRGWINPWILQMMEN